MDRIQGIEATKVGKERWSPRSFNRLGLVCVALLLVLAQVSDAVDHDWSLLESLPAWLPDLVLNGLFTLICLVGFFAFIAGAVDEYMQKSFVVEAKLSDGKSILLQLHGDSESFLSAYRSFSDRHRSAP